ncbi:hypothetical protein ECANGB1_358 [Enterospora canceri]|uniref:Uncharacterized protein n=1 Tax=Enterospora canceri TaxID=1081671 RepID=A0A1Y1S4H1_9MICR|nr:hypothetical protein ECANGB1_358 [Enterospora canceri]
MIQCGEDEKYKQIKTEYDKLKDAKTMGPTKKYLEKLLIFPDVTRGSGKVKIETMHIDNYCDCTHSEQLTFDDAYTMRDEIHSIIVNLVTKCNPGEKGLKKNIINFYKNDKVTEDDLKATIKELKEQAEISKAGEYFLDYLLYEETIKITTKIGSDCKLKAEERLEKLKKHVQKLPYASHFTCGEGMDVTTAYTYFVFTIGNEQMKSEIIKVTRKKNEEQIIQDLEEYVVEIPKEITEVRKEKERKEEARKQKKAKKEEERKQKKAKKEEERKQKKAKKEKANVEESKQDTTKQVTVKKEEPKKTKTILIVVSVIVGIVIISIVAVILIRKKKGRITKMVGNSE